MRGLQCLEATPCCLVGLERFALAPKVITTLDIPKHGHHQYRLAFLIYRLAVLTYRLAFLTYRLAFLTYRLAFLTFLISSVI